MAIRPVDNPHCLMTAEDLLPDLWLTLDDGRLTVEENALRRAIVEFFADIRNPRHWLRAGEMPTSVRQSRARLEDLPDEVLLSYKRHNEQRVEHALAENKTLLGWYREKLNCSERVDCPECGGPNGVEGVAASALAEKQRRVLDNQIVVAQLRSETADIDSIVQARGWQELSSSPRQ